MPSFIEMTGRKFGRLTVRERGPAHIQSSGKPLVTWVCDCSCGNVTTVIAGALRSGATVSCGCYSRESHQTHGFAARATRPKAYKAWSAAKCRCYSENDTSFSYYGARGIKMCDRWRGDFAAFFSDMGECPPGYSLERIDFDGDYTPDNCKWIPQSDQAKNRRGNILITHEGDTRTLSEWSRHLGIPYPTIRDWHRYQGVPFAEIVSRAGRYS